uniref:OmpH family outer membrane protein n=1 Tax=Guillardia theta TaxID=55529 RepID=A0A7S4PG24_GUITH|mmetsp:Transcript_5020/g.18081  ORF Transcript_5020/g.18081 Transcript_5020/m.18081 type:complete len:236 (+) Transcript_5020:207-914(+)
MMHSKIALALALLGISRFEVAAGSSLKMTITTPKTSQGPAQVGMVLLPASYCHRLRGGGDEGVENADLEKESMKERIQQYESLLNADTDAIQEMKDEMEAMREYMKTKLEIAASETKELKKQNEELRKNIADKGKKDAVSKLQAQIDQMTERHTKEDFEHKQTVKSLNKRISNLGAALGLAEFYFNKIFRPGEDVVISPEELDELHNVIQEINRVRIESGIVDEELEADEVHVKA